MFDQRVCVAEGLPRLDLPSLLGVRVTRASCLRALVTGVTDLMGKAYPMSKVRTRSREARRCSATAKSTRRRCGRSAIKGGTVCRYHGGLAPQVQRTARQRLQELAEPAIEALRVALDSGDARAVIRAAIAVLDRTGYGPTKAIVLQENQKRDGGSAWLEWATTDEVRTVVEITKAATARMDAGEAPASTARRYCNTGGRGPI